MNGDKKEQYEVLLQILGREDLLRTLNGNRAGSIIAANALLFSGSVFLLDKTVSFIGEKTGIIPPLFFLLVLVFCITIFFSIWKSVRCITNPFVDVMPHNLLRFARQHQNSKYLFPLTRFVLAADATLQKASVIKETRGSKLYFNPKDTISKFQDFNEMLKHYQSINYAEAPGGQSYTFDKTHLADILLAITHWWRGGLRWRGRYA